MGFDKYEKYGAYHWATACPGLRFWKYSPKTEANYIITLKQLQKHLSRSDKRFPRILDLACGDGVMTYKMRRGGLSVVGLDMENLALELGRRELNKRKVSSADLVQGSCMALPFSDHVFDGVVAMELIEHLDPQLNITFLGEIKRVLRPGGVLAITTPHKQSSVLSSLYHTQEFSAEELRNLLSRCFSHVEVFGYYSPGAQRLYFGGGKTLKPLRLLWKALWKIEGLNPFTTLTTVPTVGWENIIGVARAEK